jgi:hypothetical protein
MQGNTEKSDLRSFTFGKFETYAAVSYISKSEFDLAKTITVIKSGE